jgi:uncharacterized membrane protein
MLLTWLLILGALAFAVINIWHLIERVQQKLQQRKRARLQRPPPRSWRS